MILGQEALPERQRLRQALDGYAAEDIGRMLEFHSPGASAARRKAERIEQLVAILTDPQYARRAVAGLTPLSRRLLGIVRHAGRISLAALTLAGEREPATRTELEGLLARGLLLPEEREVGRKASLILAEQAAQYRWVWAPHAVLDALPARLEAPALAAVEREPARVEAASFAVLRRDLYLTLRFLKTQGLRLTRAGEVHRTDLRKLLTALDPARAPAPRHTGDTQREGRLLFLVRLLVKTKLARDEGDILRATDDADAFLNAPELTAARRLYDAWLDLDWDEFARIPNLTTEPWLYGAPLDYPAPERLAQARRAVGEVLGQAASPVTTRGAWFGVDALATVLRQTNPEFLVPRVSEGPPRYYGYYGYSSVGGYTQDWQLREQLYYRGLARTDARGRERRLRKDLDWADVEGAFVAQLLAEPLHWLGLVDLGFAPAGERPVVARLTSLGARLFSAGSVAEQPVTTGARLVVQPSFEILVLDALAHLDLLTALDAFAEAQSLDRAAIYRLTRPALVRGLAAGWTEERIVATLEIGAGAPLPQNVRRTLHDWVREYERVHLHRAATLLEAPDAAQLDTWLAAPPLAAALERRLTPTAALLRPVEPAALACLLDRYHPRLRATDYALDEPQQLDLRGPGTVMVASDVAEPYLDYQLRRFADRHATAPGEPVRYTIAPVTLARAREGGMPVDDILSFLGYKARVPLTPDEIVTLRGWAGYYAPFRYARVRAVELPPTANWGDLSRVKAIRPFILRVLSASLALVSEERWPEFETALAERGITLKPELAAQPASAKRQAAQRAAATLGLATGRDLPVARALGSRSVAPPLQRLRGRSLTEFIEEALDAERPLVIEYKHPSERRAKVRTVEPRELEVRGGAYYLHAFCRLRQEERDFRLSNILGVALATD